MATVTTETVVEGEVVPTAPTAIDAIQQDAAPREYPKDAPALWPYLKLPFRKRAEFFRKFREMQAMEGDLAALEKKRKRSTKNQDVMLEQAAGLYDLLAIMDDMMRIAAVDLDEYGAWLDKHNDEQFQELFAAYVERSQPGEASGSAS